MKGKIKDEYEWPLFQQYPNIKFEIFNATDIFKNTPLYDWWIDDQVTKVDGYFRVAHISDALRLALLYKHGGAYADLDTITLRSFNLFHNYSAFFLERDGGYLINSFIHVKKEHPFIKLLMEAFAIEYDRNAWSKTGPELISKYLPKYCNASMADLSFDKPAKKKRKFRRNIQRFFPFLRFFFKKK
jgi:mannosyltransferase OCH1-like enzyme